MTQSIEPRTALSTAAARNLASVTKSRPQMRGISPRWLLRALPWVETTAGVFRVNRRRSFVAGESPIGFTKVADRVHLNPHDLGQVAALYGYDDQLVLDELAQKFQQQEVPAGTTLAEIDTAADKIVVIVHGKVERLVRGAYGFLARHDLLGEGDHLSFGTEATWKFTAKTTTPCTVLSLRRSDLVAQVESSASLREHLAQLEELHRVPVDRFGQAAIEVVAGLRGEPSLRGTFADYELAPREYELNLAQAVLRVHTRISDLFNGPHDQLAEQLRLTIESVRATQERTMLTHPDFGLLRRVHSKQRIFTRSGPPTPDDLDELITRRRGTRFLFAHPLAIAAFGRRCNHRGVYPQPVEFEGQTVHAWRGIPLLPCDEIPISRTGITSILALRPGVEKQGVIGLRQTGIPDELEPGLSARWMGIGDDAVASYLVTAYFSVAALVPDAYGVLESVDIHQ